MATPGNNFCLAPFTQLTFGPDGGYSPCAEIGGKHWREPSASPITMWSSEKFQSLRDNFLSNQRSTDCNRCWEQEKFGNQSLRRRLFVNKARGSKKFKPNELSTFLENDYKKGPVQFNIKVGNKCNLRCRICNATASVTYNKEGRYYESKNKLPKTIYTSKSSKPIELTPIQIDEMFQLSSNLQRIEFYGGEPLLDAPTLTLLQKLVDSGQSKNITLFYNTNGIATPSARHFELWDKFNSIEFNISIDDVGDRFTYHRHPGKWSELLSNLDALRSHSWQVPVDFFAICSVSILNIFYITDIIDEIEKLGLPVFLNTVHGHYDLTPLPTAIKQQITKKLKTYHNVAKIKFLINMMDAPEDIDHWEKFKFWTREKDLYRNEKFSDVYPEFYKILNSYDASY